MEASEEGAWLSDSEDPSDERPKEQRVSDALAWITTIFEELEVQYVVSGGLAARIHGATRPLWDIDIDVSDEDLARLAAHPEVQKLLNQLGETGPERYKEMPWDILCMEMYYKGQRIDLTGATTMKFHNGECWIDASEHEIESVPAEFAGVSVRVSAIGDLIEYKQSLGREVDLQDVRELQKIVEEGLVRFK